MAELPKVPGVLHATSESREVALKHYTALVGLPIMTNKGFAFSDSLHYVNLDHDTLCIYQGLETGDHPQLVSFIRLVQAFIYYKSCNVEKIYIRLDFPMATMAMRGMFSAENPSLPCALHLISGEDEQVEHTLHQFGVDVGHIGAGHEAKNEVLEKDLEAVLAGRMRDDKGNHPLKKALWHDSRVKEKSMDQQMLDHFSWAFQMVWRVLA